MLGVEKQIAGDTENTINTLLDKNIFKMQIESKTRRTQWEGSFITKTPTTFQFLADYQIEGLHIYRTYPRAGHFFM